MANKDSSKSSGFTQEQYIQWAKESKANPLPRKVIGIDGKIIEVFALPGYEKHAGRYIYSGTSATDAALKGHKSFGQFLRSKSPISLPYKGFSFGQFFVENSDLPITGYPSQTVFSYWTYQLSKGNLDVLKLINSLGSTSLDILADGEFHIDRATVDYTRLIRDRFYRETHGEYALHFCTVYYDELFRIFPTLKRKKIGKPAIFARITRECFYSLFPGGANDVFDERNPYRLVYNHQFLTEDGEKVFNQIMNSFLTFLRGCRPGNFEAFMTQYRNVFGNGFQGELDI